MKMSLMIVHPRASWLDLLYIVLNAEQLKSSRKKNYTPTEHQN